MKKFLLSLAGIVAVGLTSFAAPVTISLKPNDTFKDLTGDETEVKEFTLEGVNFAFNHCKNYSDYLMVCGKTYEDAYIEFSTDIEVKSFKVHTGSNASNAVLVNFTCNGTTIPQYTELQIPKASDFTFEIPSDMQAAGTKYRIAVSKKGTNAQYTEIVLNPENGDTPTPPVVDPEDVTVNSVAETLKVAAKTKVKVNYPLLVAFVNNNNCYARDEAGDFIQVYGKNSYKADDIIPAGWEATYDLYNGTPELIPVSLPESTEQGTFIPKRYEASQIDKSMVNSVIVVTNVTFDEATPDTKTNFTGTSGDVTLTFRNNYTIASVDAGTYDVNCLVNVYQDAVQLYALNYFPAEGSGIDAIVADDAAAEYFTLQGIKVANPTEGLYIVVKNGKANKVLVK